MNEPEIPPDAIADHLFNSVNDLIQADTSSPIIDMSDFFYRTDLDEKIPFEYDLGKRIYEGDPVHKVLAEKDEEDTKAMKTFVDKAYKNLYPNTKARKDARRAMVGFAILRLSKLIPRNVETEN